MECFYHAGRPAVGQCLKCRKSTCRDCIKDVGGALFCPDCLRASAEQPVRRAKRLLLFSLAAAGLGALVALPSSAIILSDPKGGGLVGMGLIFGFFVPVCMYVVWSFYWGIVAAWGYVWKLLGHLGWIIIVPVTAAGFVFLGWVALIYGVFGGGIYQAIKHFRIAYRTEQESGVASVVKNTGLAGGVGCLLIMALFGVVALLGSSIGPGAREAETKRPSSPSPEKQRQVLPPTLRNGPSVAAPTTADVQETGRYPIRPQDDWAFLYEFSLAWRSGQVSAAGPYRMTSGDVPALAPGRWSLVILSEANQELRRYPFDPRSLATDGRFSLIVPQEGSGATAQILDPSNSKVVTIDLRESRVCNDNGVCQADAGETKKNCSTDCGRAGLAAAATVGAPGPRGGTSRPATAFYVSVKRFECCSVVGWQTEVAKAVASEGVEGFAGEVQSWGILRAAGFQTRLVDIVFGPIQTKEQLVLFRSDLLTALRPLGAKLGDGSDMTINGDPEEGFLFGMYAVHIWRDPTIAPIPKARP